MSSHQSTIEFCEIGLHSQSLARSQRSQLNYPKHHWALNGFNGAPTANPPAEMGGGRAS